MTLTRRHSGFSPLDGPPRADGRVPAPTALAPTTPTQQRLDRVDEKQRGRAVRHVVALVGRAAADQPQRIARRDPQGRRAVLEPVLDLALQDEAVVAVQAPIVARRPWAVLDDREPAPVDAFDGPRPDPRRVVLPRGSGELHEAAAGTHRPLPEAAASRSCWTSTRRRIFPDGLRGIASTASIRRMRLWRATRSPTYARRSSSSTSWRSTTNALGTSPPWRSGDGTTAASATAGCAWRTASSSAGATWRPRTLISSFSRSTRKSQ